MTDTSAQQNPSDLINQLLQWAKNGGTQAPNNVPQGSSPAITADYVANNPSMQGAFNGQGQGNQGIFSGGKTGGQGVSGSWQLNPDQQKGVQQAVKVKQKQDQQQGLQWGTQALQSGVNPQDILNHQVMTGDRQQNNSPSPNQTLQGILPKNSQQNLSPNQQISSNNQQAALNNSKQNLEESNPKNFFQRWEQNFQKMSGALSPSDRLSNIQSMQKIAGAEPISPTEAAKMNVDVRKAAIEGASKLLDTDTSTASSLTQAIAVLQQTKGPVATALHQSSPEIDAKMTDLKGVVDRIKNHSENMSNLLDSVSKSSIKSGSQSQKNLVGKITGTTSSGINYSMQ